MHAEHRTWFPFILAGASVILLVVIIVIARPADQVPETHSSGAAFAGPGVVAPTEEEYQADIVRIMTDYEEHADAGQTHAELLNVRVPVAYKNVHLDFVIAIDQLNQGNVEEGTARLDLLSTQLDWFESIN